MQSPGGFARFIYLLGGEGGSASIAPPDPPPTETFYLLAENGDRLLAENGDRLVFDRA